MPGRKTLRRVQFGLETTPGTAVAATQRWRGEAETLEDARDVQYVPEHIGIMNGTDRTIIPYAQGNLALPDTILTPEQVPYLLAIALGGPITGTADGTGSSGFRYVSTIPTTSAPTNRAMTIETGDDYEVERAAYAKCLELTIKGSQKDAVKVSATLATQPVARFAGGFSSTSIVDVNDLLFSGCILYLDAVGGTIGTTAVANQFLGFEITIKTNWILKQTGEGAAASATPSYSLVVYTGHEITGKLTLENDPAADGNTGLRSLFRSQTPRLMRIDMLGTNYTTAGTGTLFTGGRRGVRVDLPIKITKNPPLSDIENNDIITFDWESRYNATYGQSGSITVCNQVASL